MAKKEKNEEVKKGRESVTLEVKKGHVAGPGAGHRRTFTKEQHGEDFEKVAKQWAERFGAEEVTG